MITWKSEQAEITEPSLPVKPNTPRREREQMFPFFFLFGNIAPNILKLIGFILQ